MGAQPARWSTAATICTRQAAYQALGFPGDPYPEHVQRRFFRGTVIGREVARVVADEIRAQGRDVVLEHEQPWPNVEPVGVGHADLYEPGRKVIELVSSADGSLPQRKPVQAAGYAIHRGVREADILVVDPSTYETRRVPVDVDGLRPRVEEVEREMVAAVRDGVIPDRDPDKHPGAWPCIECPFVKRGCMDDYSPPPYGRLDGHEDAVARLAVIEAEASRVRRLSKDLEAERDDIRGRLAGVMDPGVDYVAAGVRVRRTRVDGRRTLSFTELEAAGHRLPDNIAAFVRQSDGHDRWTVKEIES